MKLSVDVIRAAAVLCLWPLLFGGLGLFVFYRHPRRIAFALAGAVATAIATFFFVLAGGGRVDMLGWLAVFVPACLVFVVGLLGTYIVPAKEGRTFDEWVAETKRRSMRQ